MKTVMEFLFEKAISLGNCLKFEDMEVQWLKLLKNHLVCMFCDFAWMGALQNVGGYQVPVNRPPFLRRFYIQ